MIDKLRRRIVNTIQPQTEIAPHIPPSSSQPLPPTTPQKIRKTRADKGQQRITARDRAVLNWIGEQMVVRLDHLQILLGRFQVRSDLQKAPGALTRTSAKEIVTKWNERGFTQSYKYFTDEDEFVWLTLEGQEIAGIPYRKTFNQKRGLLAHYHAVNAIRLRVEQRFGDTVQWVSERRLRYTGGNNQGHIPDGIVVQNGVKAAIEAELSNKNRDVALADIRSLARIFDNVWFFPDKQERARVEALIAQLEEDEQETFMVYPLEE